MSSPESEEVQGDLGNDEVGEGVGDAGASGGPTREPVSQDLQEDNAGQRARVAPVGSASSSDVRPCSSDVRPCSRDEAGPEEGTKEDPKHDESRIQGDGVEDGPEEDTEEDTEQDGSGNQGDGDEAGLVQDTEEDTEHDGSGNQGDGDDDGASEDGGSISEDKETSIGDSKKTSRTSGARLEDEREAKENDSTSGDNDRTSEDNDRTSVEKESTSGDINTTSGENERTPEDNEIPAIENESTYEDNERTSEDNGRTSEDIDRTSEDIAMSFQDNEKTSEKHDRTPEDSERTTEDNKKNSEDNEETSEDSEKTSEENKMTSEDNEMSFEENDRTTEDSERISEDNERTSDNGSKSDDEKRCSEGDRSNSPNPDEPDDYSEKVKSDSDSTVIFDTPTKEEITAAANTDVPSEDGDTQVLVVANSRLYSYSEEEEEAESSQRASHEDGASSDDSSRMESSPSVDVHPHEPTDPQMTFGHGSDNDKSTPLESREVPRVRPSIKGHVSTQRKPLATPHQSPEEMKVFNIKDIEEEHAEHYTATSEKAMEDLQQRTKESQDCRLPGAKGEGSEGIKGDKKGDFGEEGHLRPDEHSTEGQVDAGPLRTDGQEKEITRQIFPREEHESLESHYLVDGSEQAQKDEFDFTLGGTPFRASVCGPCYYSASDERWRLPLHEEMDYHDRTSCSFQDREKSYDDNSDAEYYYYHDYERCSTSSHFYFSF